MSVKIQHHDFAKVSRVLSSRAAGREAGASVAAELADGDVLVLNFHGVEVASPAYLTEVVNALRGPIMHGDGQWLLVTGTNEDVSDALELVLQRAKMTLGELRGDQIELIGGSEPLRETLEEAMALGTFTAPELAEQLKLKLPALHQRLNQLIEAGLLTREDDPTAQRGKRSKFRTPPTKDHRSAGSGSSIADEIATVSPAGT